MHIIPMVRLTAPELRLFVRENESIFSLTNTNEIHVLYCVFKQIVYNIRNYVLACIEY